jgi:hypothetical protein
MNASMNAAWTLPEALPGNVAGERGERKPCERAPALLASHLR